MIVFSLGFVAGGAAVWFGKDKIMFWYKGAEDYVADLKAKIEKIGK